jgi:hypothetical protein
MIAGLMRMKAGTGAELPHSASERTMDLRPEGTFRANTSTGRSM